MPVHRALAHALGFGHGSAAPVRHPLGFGLERRANQGVPLLQLILRFAPPTRLDLPDRSMSWRRDRKSTRLNSSHITISYAVFCLKKKKKEPNSRTETLRTR